MRISLHASLLAAITLTACGDDRHDERLRAAGPDPSVEALQTVADADAGARKFRTCAACHTIGKGYQDRGGPNLYGIFGRPPGQNSARYGYTAALRGAGGRWDVRRLDAWLADPARVVPGTTMQFPGVPDPLDRADLIAYLRSQSD